MRLKTDENLPEEAAEILRGAGFQADSVPSEGLAGADDANVFAAAQAEGRILATLDQGFADIRQFTPGHHGGIIVLRLKTQDREAVLALVRRVAFALGQKSAAGALWIVESDRIRFRSAPSTG